MPRTAGRRDVKQQRALQTRARLVRAGAEVFAERGFAGASVSRIAQQAGLTLGAMYFHFANKEALAREIVRSQPERVLPPVESRGLQRAVDLSLTWAHQVLGDPILLAGARLVMEQELFLPREENSHQQWTGVLAAEFDEARGSGELLPGVDVPALSRLVVNACTGAQMHAHMESGRQDLPERIEEMWRMLLPSIAEPEAARRIEFGEARAKAKTEE